MQHSSGDLRIDRRYAYAQSLLDEGESTAALDLLDQILAEAPHWAAAWFLRGEARERSGDSDAALVAFERAAALDESATLGADLRAQRLRGITPAHMKTGYVRALFDDYAPRFEQHVTAHLHYRTPQLLLSHLQHACRERQRDLHFACTADLGCGTGLMGAALRAHAGHLAGVDLSPAMLEQARARKIYDDVIAADLHGFLASSPPAHYDLLAAADVLVYCGALDSLADEAARALRPHGLFLFSVQSGPASGYRLGADLRYHHALSYLQEMAGARFAMTHTPAILRHENRAGVEGLLVLWEKI